MRIPQLFTKSSPDSGSTSDANTPFSSIAPKPTSTWRHLPARAAAAVRQTSQSALQTVLGQRPLPPSPDGRHIPVGSSSRSAPLADARRHAGHSYVSNSIRTSRYTVWDFVPKQVFFQFSRLHNFYFLMTSIFMILGWGTVGKFTAILPLLFFVSLTIAKEGWDDFRRHRLDSVENATPVAVLGREGEGCFKEWTMPGLSGWRKGKDVKEVKGTEKDVRGETAKEKPTFGVKISDDEYDGFCWVRKRWMDIRVGDMVHLSRDEPVPADIVVLHASGPNRSAYIETMALDGETNLKSRFVCPILPALPTVQDLVRFDAAVVAEDPNPDLYRFEGRLTYGGETRPLTTSEVAYRGSIVRNTDAVVGLVVNTGEECKMRMNANKHPQAKRPALESAVNIMVLTLVAYVLVLSGGFTAGYRQFHASEEWRAWYLDGETVPLHYIIFGFIILFNSIVPLSLYVTLEFIKIGQMMLLNWDVEMYHEETDTPARCNTNTILENLGQVGYVFSDKTGTLTENVMKFRKISLGGMVWQHDLENKDIDDTHATTLATTQLDVSSVVVPMSPLLPITTDVIPEEEPQGGSTVALPLEPSDAPTSDLVEYMRQRPHTRFAQRAREYVLALALCHTCLPEMVDGKVQFQASSPDELALVEAARELGVTLVERTSETVTLLVDDERVTFEVLDVIEFSSKRKRMTVVVRCPDGRLEVICKGADSVVLPRLRMSEEAQRRAREVRASVEVEHEMHRRSDQFEMRNSLTLRRLSGSHSGVVATRQSFEVSKLRKSMDVMHSPVSPRFSLDQWASPGRGSRRRFSNTHHPSHYHHQHVDRFSHLDDPHLLDDDGAIFDRCFRHLDGFATTGLRTLVFARKTISAQDYAAWKTTFDDATTSLVDRQDKIEEAGELLEQGFDLLGASAIEDKLQHGVPETVDKLRRAGIKVWMLTGDKRETAVNIAHSAGICRPASDVYVLDSSKNAPLSDQIAGLADDLVSGAVAHSVAVVDGHTLSLIEKCPALSDSFFRTAPLVDSVICCRASPAQKALLVRSVRASLGPSSGLTLAIGDGANDLAMIEASHVGIGISGNEGLQAARVADYAVAQFRFLQRLLLVHGRWNYVRTTKFILATFWKEIFFYLPTALFQMHNGFSGTSLYHETSLTVFNSLFTSLCVLVMGMTEQDLSADALLALPELYVYGQRGKGMNLARCASWITNALVHGTIAWFVIWAGLRDGPNVNFGDQGLYSLGHAIFTVGIVWINYKLMILETHYKTWIVGVGFAITVGGWFIWTILLDGVFAPGVSPYAIRHTFTRVFGRDLNWWSTILTCLLLMWIFETVWKVVVGSLRRRGCEDAFDRLLGGGEANDTTNGIFVIDEGTDSMTDVVSDSLGKGGDSFGGTSRRNRQRRMSRFGFGGGLGVWEAGVWQELERNEAVRERLGEILREEEQQAAGEPGEMEKKAS